MPELESFHPADLALYHRNPRLGSVDVIESSLRAHGQYRPIVVNRGTHTGRPNEVLAGNHTVKAFRNLAETDSGNERWQAIHAYMLDVDEDSAARIILVDNRSAELGSFDDAVLADLLTGLPDLDGTGYTDLDLQAITEMIGGPPDIDDLAEKYGEPTDEDGLSLVRLTLAPHVADQWKSHRGGFDDDTAALEAALDR